MHKPDISIVTPCLNPGHMLALCCASVRDQEDVQVEHIVIDGGSTDGTVTWLEGQSDVIWLSEPDHGMYDAVNKGLRMAKGRILAYLNSDEQYLPGALFQVMSRFDHSDVDMLFADTVVVDPQGEYLCSRQSLVPWYYHSAFCELATLTASTFFRREVVASDERLFDTRWKTLGDVEWMLRLLQAGVKMDVLRAYTSVFTDSGNNLALSDQAKEEAVVLRRKVSSWCWIGASVIRILHRIRRLMAGLYRLDPFSYRLYKGDNLKYRQTVNVSAPTFLWRARIGGD